MASWSSTAWTSRVHYGALFTCKNLYITVTLFDELFQIDSFLTDYELYIYFIYRLFTDLSLIYHCRLFQRETSNDGSAPPGGSGGGAGESQGGLPNVLGSTWGTSDLRDAWLSDLRMGLVPDLSSLRMLRSRFGIAKSLKASVLHIKQVVVFILWAIFIFMSHEPWLCVRSIYLGSLG